jgi:hypothetical protein
MDNDLNLITGEEIFEQKTSLIFKILNILFVLVFLVTLGFSIYSYIENNKLLEIENNLQSQKESLLTQLAGFSSEESVLRDVIHRYDVYSDFHSQIEDFSEIVKEIYIRALGTNIEIMTINFNYENKEISIRVKSTSEQFTRFVNNLKNPDFKGEGTIYPNLFFPSERNEEVDQAIREYIVYVKYRPEVVKK